MSITINPAGNLIAINSLGKPIEIVAPPEPVPASLIYYETFEGSDYFPSANGNLNQIHDTGWENCNTEVDAGGSVASTDDATYDYGWTLTRVTTPTPYEGTKCVKFEIRHDQPHVGSADRIRSEVTIIKPQEDSWWPGSGSENLMWYSFAILFPSVGQEADLNADESINQWFEDGGRDCNLKTQNAKFYFGSIQNVDTPADPTTAIRIYYDMFGATDAAPTTSISTVRSSFTAIPFDEWHHFVFNFVHSNDDAEGFVRIWRDGVIIQTIFGMNMHTVPAVLPKWKIGPYKSDWTGADVSTRTMRKIYFDKIKVGNAGASLADML